jgi:predicted RNA binding protein YcfA (HicA-like mRNA interferase family)
MSKLPALKPKRVLQALFRAGFVINHQKGSHVQLRHPAKPSLRVTIAMHTRFDLPGDVVASIMTQADVTREEFLKLLSK